MTGSEAHRLWRLLAYKMAAPQAHDEREREEEGGGGWWWWWGAGVWWWW